MFLYVVSLKYWHTLWISMNSVAMLHDSLSIFHFSEIDIYCPSIIVFFLWRVGINHLSKLKNKFYALIKYYDV